MWHGRTKRLSARKNFAFHARIRMLQRHDVKITNEDLAKMEAMLRNGRETVLISRSGCSVKVAVPYRDRVFPVIYDEHRRQIVTFLKEEFLTPTQKERFDMCHPHIDLPHTVFRNPVIPEDMVLPVFDEDPES
ncbi:MAG: hypothetical protein MJ025_07275 [Victivallaceae bacterium]|nr:hypothetical protein [Victivallaceae bacterium]